MKKRKAVIYRVTNKINGKVYVGQSINYKRRKYSHIYNSKRDNPQFSLLDSAIRKYGENSFEWDILWEGSYSNIDGKEKYYIKKLNSQIPNGYNVESGGRRGKDAEIIEDYHYVGLFSNTILNKFMVKCNKHDIPAFILDYDEWVYSVPENFVYAANKIFNTYVNIFNNYAYLITDEKSYKRVIMDVNRIEKLEIDIYEFKDSMQIHHELNRIAPELIKYVYYNEIPYTIQNKNKKQMNKEQMNKEQFTKSYLTLLTPTEIALINFNIFYNPDHNEYYRLYYSEKYQECYNYLIKNRHLLTIEHTPKKYIKVVPEFIENAKKILHVYS